MNAGSGAVRVVLGAAVPPPVVVLGVLEAAVVPVFVVGCVLPPVVCTSAGGVVADTVFVPEPQPVSSAVLDEPARRAPRLCSASSHPWYSPPALRPSY